VGGHSVTYLADAVGWGSQGCQSGRVAEWHCSGVGGHSVTWLADAAEGGVAKFKGKRGKKKCKELPTADPTSRCAEGWRVMVPSVWYRGSGCQDLSKDRDRGSNVDNEGRALQQHVQGMVHLTTADPDSQVGLGSGHICGVSRVRVCYLGQGLGRRGVQCDGG
jgi:hypothetical protein